MGTDLICKYSCELCDELTAEPSIEHATNQLWFEGFGTGPANAGAMPRFAQRVSGLLWRASAVDACSAMQSQTLTTRSSSIP